jgi:ribonuclease VapC
VLWNEPEADRVLARLVREKPGARRMSVASYLETGSVLASRRKRDPKKAVVELDAFLADAGIDLAAVDVGQATAALTARIRFGRGCGSGAGLNYGDCFSYALAKSLDAPLLVVGKDFTKTDVKAAL